MWPVNRWSEVRRETIERAEAVIDKVWKGLPVDLKSVADQCRVRRIKFQPLLLDGGLAVTNEGFYIYVRSDAESGPEFTACFAKDGTGRTLPKHFAKRARFTIAHEIAHALLYDTSSFPPKHTEKVDAASLGGLEHTCNVVAAALMLPERIFENEYSGADLLDPNILLDIAETALVPKATLVLRFRRLRRAEHPVGLIARVELLNGDWVFTATSLHYSLRELFAPYLRLRTVRALVDDPSFALCDGDKHIAKKTFQLVAGERQFKFRADDRLGKTAFLTAYPIGAA